MSKPFTRSQLESRINLKAEDPGFKKKLMSNPAEAIKEVMSSSSEAAKEKRHFPNKLHFKVLEEDQNTCYIVLRYKPECAVAMSAEDLKKFAAAGCCVPACNDPGG